MRRTPLRRGTKPLRRTKRLRARGNTKYRRRERDIPYMLWVKKQPCIVREMPPVPALVHAYVQHPEFPWFCGECGYAEHEASKHPQMTPCTGRVEADHAGERGIGQKADDRTCIPLCRQHHGERTNHKGPFFHMTRDELRTWRTEAIARTQAAWEQR